MQTQTEQHTPPHTDAPLDPWLNLEQGGRHAGVHPATLRREMRRGRLRYAKVGGRKSIRLRRSWIDAWLEASATPIEVSR